MSEMIERVAKAIYSSSRYPDLNEPNWDDQRDQLMKNDIREIAKASIAAMREPTDKMIEAGNTSNTDGRGADLTWTAMIYEALK